ncbi:MAG: insulinase family protein [Clostridia bacterium]|nr:insulinase family protein [Clostridia bacterium]
MQEILNTQLDERYYCVKHSSGLTVYVMPKANYKSCCAVFGTKYGSIDTTFRKNRNEEFTIVPEGIAHFLEHKLFESEELDAFARYAETGASANAYTSFDKTCYYFTCTDNFDKSLEILLDFVTSPYFTEKTVEKEQGIISQEIQMYDDVPSWRVFFNVLGALYHNHPVKIDIAGTTESIRKIDAELLYKCYNTFYNLRNMVLCVAGNVTVEQVMSVVDKVITTQAELCDLERQMPEEPSEVVTDLVKIELDVKSPVFSFGYKDECDGEKSLKEQLEMQVLLEAVAGSSSELYKKLFDMKLINDAFGSEYFCGNGYASVLFQGESANPEAVAKEIKAEIERLQKKGIDEEAFNNARKLLYGRAIMSLNDVDYIANEMVGCHFEHCGLFESIDIYRSMTLASVQKKLENAFDNERTALSIVAPISKAE